MISAIEPTLYLDPQAAVPVGFCPGCGAERYCRGTPCPFCGRKEP